MSNPQKLQANRYELKYLVDEPRAHAIREYVGGYMELDENASNDANRSYPIHSLYLDSDTMMLYRQTSVGMKNRFKLRIRFYDSKPDGPAFLEIKRRLTDVICKERTSVSRDAAFRLLKGERLSASDLFNPNQVGRGLQSLERFCDLVEDVDAQPATYVSYIREAYVCEESDQLRVTMDRQIRANPFNWNVGVTVPPAGILADVAGVVLELKFTDRFPRWMRDLVWAFDLERCSVPKYLHCIDSLGLTPTGTHVDLGKNLARKASRWMPSSMSQERAR